jgi:hypothetical protein
MMTLRLSMVALVAGITLHGANARAQAPRPAPTTAAPTEPGEVSQHEPDRAGGKRSATEMLTPISAEFVGQHKNLVIKFGDLLDISPGAYFQLRYTLNYRTDAPGTEDNVTSLFNVPRSRFMLGVRLTPHFRAFARAGTKANGDFRLERALADLSIWKLRIRFGRLFMALRIPDEFGPHMLQAADLSSTDNAFDPGTSHGAQVRFAHDWFRATLSVIDGLRTGFSEVLAPIRADVGVGGRFEFLALGKDWGRFDDQGSFPGSGHGLRVVLAGYYQTGGNTGTTQPLELVYLTGGVHGEFSRFSLVLNGTGGYVDYKVVAPVWEYSFVAQAGVFVIDHLELWARFDGVWSDGNPRPASADPSGTTDFRTVSGGLNLFAFPPTHRVKLQLDFQYMFDPQATSLVPTWPNNGVLATATGQQWAMRVQTVVSF